MKIRRAEPSDLAQIVQIEGLCFPEETAFPPKMFAYLIRYAVSLVACEPEKKVLGFIMGYTSGNGRRRLYPGRSPQLPQERHRQQAHSWLWRRSWLYWVPRSIRLEAALDKTGGSRAIQKSRLPGERAGQELLWSRKSCGADVEESSCGEERELFAGAMISSYCQSR